MVKFWVLTNQFPRAILKCDYRKRLVVVRYDDIYKRDFMLNIAVVDDTQSDANVLLEYLARYEKENAVTFKIERFNDGLAFISDYKPKFDIIFLDIEMPYLNGMQTAKKLREVDAHVVIIFYSKMVRFAVAGYSVNALDFLVKPAPYPEFEKKMKRAVRTAMQVAKEYITVGGTGGIIKLLADDILYVEKEGNNLVYHTMDGEYSERANLYVREEALEKLGFVKCRSGCMVNMKHVSKCMTTAVTVGNVEIPISRSKQKTFMNKVLLFLTGN